MKSREREPGTLYVYSYRKYRKLFPTLPIHCTAGLYLGTTLYPRCTVLARLAWLVHTPVSRYRVSPVSRMYPGIHGYRVLQVLQVLQVLLVQCTPGTRYSWHSRYCTGQLGSLQLYIVLVHCIASGEVPDIYVSCIFITFCL